MRVAIEVNNYLCRIDGVIYLSVRIFRANRLSFDPLSSTQVNTVKDSVQIPIAVLKAGETRAVNPDVEFYESKVVFKLIKGSGPVYIHGHNIKDDVEVVDMEEEEDEDDVAEDEEDEHPKKRAKIENAADAKNNKNNKKK